MATEQPLSNEVPKSASQQAAAPQRSVELVLLQVGLLYLMRIADKVGASVDLPDDLKADLLAYQQLLSQK